MGNSYRTGPLNLLERVRSALAPIANEVYPEWQFAKVNTERVFNQMDLSECLVIQITVRRNEIARSL